MSQCENGHGALISNRYMMNVYEIQDPQAFRDSAAQITAPNTAAPSVASPSSGSGTTDSSAVDGRLNGTPVFNAGLITLFSLSMITIFVITLL